MLKTMKRCKRSGQTMRNEDRISQLPEDLLLQILSLLPTKDVVATSALSKRWRTLWKVVPKLKFIYEGVSDFQTFADYVGRTLLSHKGPVIQSLHLFVIFEEYLNTSMDLGVLVGVALGLHVRELKLEFYWEEGFFTFPGTLYNFEKLETLKLVTSCGGIIVNVPSPVCLKSLRTLHLHEVGYINNESVVNLLSGCFSLEDLVVYRTGYDGAMTFTIAVPSLQRLTITDEAHGLVYVIKAPSLKYLNIKGHRLDLGSCLIGNAPKLMEANIDIGDVIIENIWGSLTSITFPSGSIFHQLEYLEMRCYRYDWWNLLTLMFDSSPRLRVLKLIGSRSRWDVLNNVARAKWIQPKNVPECLLLYLETLVLSVWTCYGGKLEEEKEVVKYILRNASPLKKATFSKNDIAAEEESVKVVEELKNVVRASSSCQIVFE